MAAARVIYMVGARSEREVSERRFLNRFRVVDVQGVAALSVARRREQRLKLPDAVIYATAQAENCLLVTRNTNFDVTLPNVRIPYAL
jgi:predicted nucleic acid-binding protein